MGLGGVKEIPTVQLTMETANTENEDENGDEMGILEVDKRGKLYIQSQVLDYCYHCDKLAGHNVYDSFCDTWEDKQHSRKETM